MTVKWNLISNLHCIYHRAHCLKHEVYEQWLDRLRSLLLRGDDGMRAEAIRRMEYIEARLMGGMVRMYSLRGTKGAIAVKSSWLLESLRKMDQQEEEYEE